MAAIPFLADIDLAKNALLNASVQPLAVAPPNPVVGQVYFDTALVKLRVWTGTEWADATGTGSAPGGPLRGVGFPNGVVSAPVGTTYVDTAATNGAIEWKKATGTGNTGWVVSFGDTGWMNIGSLLINGWTANYVRMRRINETVRLAFENLSPALMTNTVALTLPVGFRQYGLLYSRQFLTPPATPAQVYRLIAGTDGVITLPGVTTSAPGLYGDLTILTTPGWPTTLPGTAA